MIEYIDYLIISELLKLIINYKRIRFLIEKWNNSIEIMASNACCLYVSGKNIKILQPEYLYIFYLNLLEQGGLNSHFHIEGLLQNILLHPFNLFTHRIDLDCGIQEVQIRLTEKLLLQGLLQHLTTTRQR